MTLGLQSLWPPGAVEVPHSLMPIGWSDSLGFRVPSASVWHVLETATAGVIVSVVAYWLASRRLKTSRWHERQGEAYGQILKDLEIFAKAA